MKRTLAVLAVLVALPLVARAQKPVTQTDSVEVTAKIEAIDKTARLVTLKDKDGEMETIKCGPEVKRFDELKVGDTVTFRYYESIASILAVSSTASVWVTGFWARATTGRTTSTASTARVLFMTALSSLESGLHGPETAATVRASGGCCS